MVQEKYAGLPRFGRHGLIVTRGVLCLWRAHGKKRSGTAVDSIFLDAGGNGEAS